MGKPCRFFISLTNLLGIILASIGFGMLLVLIIPWWGYLLAFCMLISGICLICVHR